MKEIGNTQKEGQSRKTTERETYQVRLPQAFAHAKQLLRSRAADNKVLGKVYAPDAIETANEGLAGLGLESGHDGRDEVWPEAALVQARRNEVRKGPRRDVALLAQSVQVNLVAEKIRDGRHVGSEPRQPQEYVAVLKHFGEVVGDGEGLEAEAEIAGDGDAVLADHGDTGASVCCSTIIRVSHMFQELYNTV